MKYKQELQPFLVVVIAFICSLQPSVDASKEVAAVGNPKCDPAGRWKPSQRLNFTESKARGATVIDNGFSWLTNLDHCANWCCKLPAENCSVAMLEIKQNGANCHYMVCYPMERCVFSDAADFLSYDRTLFVQKVEETTQIGQEDQENPLPHKSVIKPRKGVEEEQPPPAAAANPKISETPTPKTKKKTTSVAIMFLYAAIILVILGAGAFFGQKFLDCWERRHYTRADYLLDGMYDDHKSTSCNH